ncbi:hypothetical protein WR25_19063 [Diploscapter pachys]|uniref:Uncharacterized protein n=1 Tax=Diploscapter pachys TaxID=2018661 RepID=A0A2A2M2R7_9BILA|nr:hypothetical protein WR25_19063 [Diploscapter pachys]
MPRGSMPQCDRKRRSSIARNASVTCGGSLAASTGLSMIAPRRAIGVPSSAVSVIDGGVGGCNDLLSGAVTASQPIAMTSRTMPAAIPRRIQRPIWRGRRGGCSAAASCSESRKASNRPAYRSSSGARASSRRQRGADSKRSSPSSRS